MAPCSHVWHYKCIRPILNNHKQWPQFLCPNCRAVTDLDADIEDTGDGDWEDENDTGSSPEVAATHATNGFISAHDESANDGDDDVLSRITSRVLSMRDDPNLKPTLTNSSDSIGGLSTSISLHARRGAHRISPPFLPSSEQPNTRHGAGRVQLLRPVTPTQPLLGVEALNEPSIRTPGTDILMHDGPMTPTNNAGPFVFDGSAGRAAGRRADAVVSESAEARSLST